jgi:hypothetical protein
MAEPSDDRVDLTELDVITRYSLAVRVATADRAELIEALRTDLAWLEDGRARTTTTTRRAPSARRTPARNTAARRS